MGAPSWLGIGAQRSGTTWFTALLCQHPQVDLGTNDVKEQQLLHRVADGLVPQAEYFDLFPDDGIRRGEFSPSYLRHPSMSALVARTMPAAPIVVLLRDPVERYRSAMRLAAFRGRSYPFPVPQQLQTWAGMYADQLDAWAHFVGRDRLKVMVYEQARTEPQAAVDLVWRDLGLEPVPLQHSERPSPTTSRASWDWPEGTREMLQVLYSPQARRLVDDWGLDLTAWVSLA
jgi:hypothetical protein